MKDTAKRKDLSPLKVYCLSDEREQVQARADAAGLSLSIYLRRVGIGYEIQSILDHQSVQDLAKVNGDLSRLGGLLKLWLVHDPRTADISSTTLRALLKKIEILQNELREIITKVVRK